MLTTGPHTMNNASFQHNVLPEIAAEPLQILIPCLYYIRSNIKQKYENSKKRRRTVLKKTQRTMVLLNFGLISTASEEDIVGLKCMNQKLQ